MGPLPFGGEEGLNAGGVPVWNGHTVIGVDGKTQAESRTVFGAEAGQRQCRESSSFGRVDVGVRPSDGAGPQEDRRQNEVNECATENVCVACFQKLMTTPEVIRRPMAGAPMNSWTLLSVRFEAPTVRVAAYRVSVMGSLY